MDFTLQPSESYVLFRVCSVLIFLMSNSWSHRADTLRMSRMKIESLGHWLNLHLTEAIQRFQKCFYNPGFCKLHSLCRQFWEGQNASRAGCRKVGSERHQPGLRAFPPPMVCPGGLISRRVQDWLIEVCWLTPAGHRRTCDNLLTLSGLAALESWLPILYPTPLGVHLMNGILAST